VPDQIAEHGLEKLLAYPDDSPLPGDAFVDSVMRRVQKERYTRRIILYTFGLIGAAFGITGVSLLSGKITWLFTEVLDGTLMMQAALFMVAALAFYTWFMNDELKLEN